MQRNHSSVAGMLLSMAYNTLKATLKRYIKETKGLN